MLTSKLKALLGTAIVVLGAIAAGAADSSPIRHVYFATSPDDGGLGGSFASIHGVGPYPGPVWDAYGGLNSVFAASFAGGVNVDTSGSWNGSSNICCMGIDTWTSYGQTFIAPSSELTSFSFLMQKTQVGHLGYFGIAPVDFPPPGGVGEPIFLGPPIFVEEFVGVSGPDYMWQSFSSLDVQLMPGQEYLAYEAPWIPESSTWAMMLIGFASLGFAAFHQKRNEAARIAA